VAQFGGAKDTEAAVAPRRFWPHHCDCTDHRLHTNEVMGSEILEPTGMAGGLEVTGETVSSQASIASHQPWNRLHAIKAVLVARLGS
jgi:ornithine carbamoyltransferase